jgi:Holliday junction resolvase RusA-like endonuclease
LKKHQIVLPGKPIAKARARTLKSGHSYNPQSEIEAAVQWQMRQWVKDNNFSIISEQEPFALLLEARFLRPKSHYGTGRNSAILKPSAPKYHIAKPDGDNLLKFYLDAGQGILWMDDKTCGNMVALKDWQERGEGNIGLITLTFWRNDNS